MANNQKPASVWLVRAGANGEDEDVALSQGRALVGFRLVNDASRFIGVDDVAKAFLEKEPGWKRNRAVNLARQLMALRSIEPNDIVVLPLKTRPGQIALGRASGRYEYATVNGEKRHSIPVRWLKPDVARSTFAQDLLHSFGAFMTICQIKRNDAALRVTAVLEGNPDPGWKGDAIAEESKAIAEADDSATRLNLKQAAHDEVVAAVRRRFPSHELARLVGAILEADGYLTQVSPPGPDGGADILAGRGPLGLDGPTLCVQVKATTAAADVRVFRELIGTMESCKAAQGLLVCWGGFTQPMRLEARQHVFKVKLWDQSELVDAIYRTYERLIPEIQAELPLAKIWTLLAEDESD